MLNKHKSWSHWCWPLTRHVAFKGQQAPMTLTSEHISVLELSSDVVSFYTGLKWLVTENHPVSLLNMLVVGSTNCAQLMIYWLLWSFSLFQTVRGFIRKRERHDVADICQSWFLTHDGYNINCCLSSKKNKTKKKQQHAVVRGVWQKAVPN